MLRLIFTLFAAAALLLAAGVWFGEGESGERLARALAPWLERAEQVTARAGQLLPQSRRPAAPGDAKPAAARVAAPPPPAPRPQPKPLESPATPSTPAPLEVEGERLAERAPFVEGPVADDDAAKVAAATPEGPPPLDSEASGRLIRRMLAVYERVRE